MWTRCSLGWRRPPRHPSLAARVAGAGVGLTTRGMMRPVSSLRIFTPPPQAAPWVHVGVAADLPAALAATHFPAMAQAMLTLRLTAAGGSSWRLCPPITFHTLSTRPVVYPHAGDIKALGLLLRPAAAATLLGAAGAVQVDAVLPWQALAGDAEASRAEEVVAQAPDDAARLAALLQSLQRTMQRASRGREAEQARLLAAIGQHGAQAGASLGLGPRQLERRCQALLGLAPKPFQRLLRFQQALSLSLTTGLPGAQLALEAGYCDQSHLAREVRQMAGRPLQALHGDALAGAAGWPMASHRLWRAAAG